MKHILRTLIILAAAILISVITYVIVNNNGATQSTLAGFSGEGEGMHRGRGNLEGAAPDGFAEGRMERHNEGGSLLGLSGLMKNLGIVAVIVAVYWLIEKLIGLVRNRFRRVAA